MKLSLIFIPLSSFTVDSEKEDGTKGDIGTCDIILLKNKNTERIERKLNNIPMY